MKLDNKFLLQNNINIKIFFIFCFFSSWMSLSSTLDDLIIKFNVEDQNLIYEIINFLRTISNILCFVILSYFFVKHLSEKKIKNYLNIYLIFSFYFLFQIPGLFLTFNMATVPHSKSKHQRICTHIVICVTKRAKECHTTVWGMNNGDK